MLNQEVRARGALPQPFAAIEPTGRAALSADIAAFVPDDLPVDRLLQYSTSGTSGHPLYVPSHPTVSASYLAFHQRALREFGITLTAAHSETDLKQLLAVLADLQLATGN